MTTTFQTRRDILVSFDGGERSSIDVARPDKLRFWTDQDWSKMPVAISRGAGLSYAGASFGTGVVSIDHQQFDRLVAFDEGTGELTVEAGANLWTCQQFLLSRGFFLPCHPGHGRITIGGCVAADVHGKNPWRDGTFSAQVRGLTLLHPDHGILTIDRDTEPELLALTCGAFGLTGHILTVTLAARALSSPTVTMTRRVFDTSAEAFENLSLAVRTSDFAYSWHDLSIRNGGHLVLAATVDSEPSELIPVRTDGPPPLSAASVQRLPFAVYNRLSLPVVNAAYRWKTRQFDGGKRVSVLDTLFPTHGSQFYFSLYGKTGFHEYQMLVQLSEAAIVVDEVKKRAARHGVPIALCSAKAFGGEERFLRFAGEGIAIAFNFVRSKAGDRLMADIDALVIAIRGKPNIVKDSRLTPEVLCSCHPGLDDFRSALRRFDPHRRIRSSLSERLEL